MFWQPELAIALFDVISANSILKILSVCNIRTKAFNKVTYIVHNCICNASSPPCTQSLLLHVAIIMHTYNVIGYDVHIPPHKELIFLHAIGIHTCISYTVNLHACAPIHAYKLAEFQLPLQCNMFNITIHPTCM